MRAWLSSNIGTIIICAILAAIVGAIVISLIKKKKRGGCGCGCGCGSDCPHCGKSGGRECG